MDRSQIQKTLHDLQNGKINIANAMKMFSEQGFADLGFAKVDHSRSSRCGIPEVIFAAGKTPQQIIQIAGRLRKSGDPLLITRIEPRKYQSVRFKISGLQFNETAQAAFFLDKSRKLEGGIAIVTAGTSDLPIAEEAAVTCRVLGFAVEQIYDVGVAGIHRLLAHAEVLNTAKVLIVVAGMEGALPSVIGGLVDAPVIAVPTSVGYGASFGGMAALLAMLNSCAAGVTVVNIDNGFGAAVAAVKIMQKIASPAIKHASKPRKPK